jgi:tripartite-type tricarboxylate transporter receptor subunit TctC
MKRAFRRFSLLIVAVTMAGAALAQYRAKPVRIVVPYPPGCRQRPER